MRGFYPLPLPAGAHRPVQSGVRFKTFRSQLLWNYLLAIGALVIVSVAVVISVYSFSSRTDELVYGPTELVRISSELNDAHQYMANFVNYDDPSYLDPYRAAVADLSRRLASFEPTVRSVSRDRNDVELLYSYLEINNQLEWYEESGEALIARVTHGEDERFARFEQLYDLRDLKGRIASALTDLVFRQMNHTQSVYDTYRRNLRNNWLVFFALFGVAVIALVQIVVRQARNISEPIRQLVAQGRQIASHDYRVSALKDSGNVELQTLSDTFVDMAAEIGRSIEVLNQKNALERSNLEMVQSLKQAELELLQSQINPHFLFNTLNTITSLARIENAKETEELLSSFSRFLRFNLRSMSTVVTVERELEIVQAYLFIQKQRFGKRLSYTVDADADALPMSIPSLTVQPFVENSLIHGIEPRREGGSVNVSISRHNDETLVLVVEDTGVGMSADQAAAIQSKIATMDDEKREHLGIVNTMRRVQLYDAVADLSIETAPGRGTTVSMTFRPGRVAEPVAMG